MRPASMLTSTDLVTMAGTFGEWSETKQVGFIQTICDQVKDQVERETGVNYEEFSAVEYRSHFVEVAVNYLIKVHIGGADYDHLSVSQEIIYPVGPAPPELLGVQQHKIKEDPLVPFPPNVLATGGLVVEWSGTMDASEETQKICHELKDQVERETGFNYQEFTAVEYRYQILAGEENFLIKVRVGGTHYDHLSVSQDIMYVSIEPIVFSPVLRGVEKHKTREDPLVPFPPNVVPGADRILGGWSKTKDATEETQKICHQVKGQVEKKTGVNYKEFTAVEYRNQVVKGENFLIKVRVGGADYDHLSVFRALPCYGGQVVLLGVEQHKTREDPLELFPPNVVAAADKFREWSLTKVATEETQSICHEVRGQVEKKTGINYKEFRAVEYRYQMLYGGENFLIKVCIGGVDYDHLLVFRELDDELDKVLSVELLGVLQHKTKEDPLLHFPPNLVAGADAFGKLSQIMIATMKTQENCHQVKDQVEKKTGVNYKKFTAVEYRNQNLAGGENFLIKVHVGGADYDHLLVSQPFSYETVIVLPVELLGVLQHKTKEDPLEPFPPNAVAKADRIPGGWSPTKDATEETQKLCRQVKGQVEKKTGINYKEFTAVVYRNQIVNGEKFLIKVHVGADYIHLSVFQEYPCNGGQVRLCGVLQHKTREAPLLPFPN